MNAVTDLFNNSSDPIASDQLVAFVADPEIGETLSGVIMSRWPTALVEPGGLEAAIERFTQEASPPVIVVDVSTSPDPVSAMAQLVGICAPETRVVGVGTANDVRLYRSLTGAGAVDYLVHPVTVEALAEAVAAPRQTAEQPKSSEGKEAKIITVTGARGGVGSTTVAVNLAWTLAHVSGKQVALIDLDLKCGTVALSLDLEPTHGLREALENPGRIDSLFIASAMANESENLLVLSAEEGLEQHLMIDEYAVEALLRSLRSSFDAIVVDMPRSASVDPTSVIASSNSVVIVSELSLSALRDTARIMALAKAQAPEATVTIVVNKDGKGEMPKAEFERGVGAKIGFALPHDPKAAGAAANAGKAVAQVAKGSGLAKALGEASLQITNSEQQAKAKSKLFGRKRGA